MWLELEMVFREITILVCFAWLISFLMWVLMWRGYPVAYNSLQTVADG
jgi:hypothetical protein